MRRALSLFALVMLILLSLLGCRKTSAPTNSQPPPTPPPAPTSPFKVLKTTVIIGGRITELKEQGENVLEEWQGEFVLDFNSPVDKSTLPDDLSVDSGDKSRVRGWLSGHQTMFEIPKHLCCRGDRLRYGSSGRRDLAGWSEL